MKPASENNFFDRHAGDYEKILRGMVGAFDGNLDYFAAYKIEILRRKLATPPRKILDFGAGIGRSLPFFRAAFPSAELHGFDPSAESLAHAARACPEAILHSNWNQLGEGFDLVFLAGVLHHLPEAEALSWMERARAICGGGGVIAIFEHNLKNPVTRRLVTNCDYDRDARFYAPSETKALLERAGFHDVKSEYCLFFPALLKPLRSFEKFLGGVPLGGQYFVLGTRPSGAP